MITYLTFAEFRSRGDIARNVVKSSQVNSFIAPQRNSQMQSIKQYIQN